MYFYFTWDFRMKNRHLNATVLSAVHLIRFRSLLDFCVHSPGLYSQNTLFVLQRHSLIFILQKINTDFLKDCVTFHYNRPCSLPNTKGPSRTFLLHWEYSQCLFLFLYAQICAMAGNIILFTQKHEMCYTEVMSLANT